MQNPYLVESNQASEMTGLEVEGVRLAIMAVAWEIAQLKKGRAPLMYRGKTAEEWLDLKIEEDRKRERGEIGTGVGDPQNLI